jgi:hypothetical protein
MAKNTIGNLHIEVDIALQKMQAQLDQMGRRVKTATKKSTGDFTDFAAKAKGALASLGVGISVGSFTSATTQLINYGSKIADLSVQAKTGSDAFQALAISARDDGVEFEQTAKSLEFLRKSISETAAGTGEARNAFKALNLDARKLADMPLERALEQVAVAVANAEDKTAAYGYALDILGSKNVPKLQGLLNRLATEGFDKVAESAKGLIITPEQLASLDAAGDKIERMKTAALVFGAQNFNRWYELVGGLREGETVMGSLNTRARGLVELIAQVNPKARLALEAFDDLHGPLAEAEAEAQRLVGGLISGKVAATEMLGPMREIALTMEEAAAAAKAFAEGEEFIAKHLTEVENNRTEAIREAVALNERAARLGERQDAAALDALHPLDRAVELKKRLIALEGQQTEAVGDSNEAFAARLDYEEKIFDVRQQLVGLGSTVDESMDSFFGNLDEASKSMGKLEKETGDATDMAKELGNTFASAFEEAIVRGGDFKDVLRGLAQDILRLFVRQQISAPIANFFSSAFSSLFGGGKAGGGDVDPSKFYLVGEEGPEAFIPDTAGKIIPAAQTHAMREGMDGGGGGGPPIYIDARGADREGLNRLEAMIGALHRSIEHRAVAAVIDGKRRRSPGLNGAFA